MREIQFVFWRVPVPQLADETSVSWNRPAWMHSREAAGVVEGWDPVSYQIVGAHESGDMVMSVMLTREVDDSVPADLSSIEDHSPD